MAASAAAAAAAAAMKPSRAALEFLDYVNASPTPFHAVAAAAALLERAGFVRIRERDDWSATVRGGGRYFLTREGSSIVAFAVGGRWRPGGPVGMVGAHTDSPCLRVKPASRRQANGFMQVGVECYGGGLWRTWFDRDLALAGRLLVHDDDFPTPSTATMPTAPSPSPPSPAARPAPDGPFVQRLVRIDRPVLRVPSLAIHLDRDPTFKFNKETELLPIAGMVAAELNRTGKPAAPAAPAADETALDWAAAADDGGFDPLKLVSERHHPYVVELVAEQAGVQPSQIADMELVLYDKQEACVGGLHDEFIFSARLDNLNMTYCAVKALIASVSSSSASDPSQAATAGGSGPSLDNDTTIRMAACFDHEEIGSVTAQGANGDLIPSVVHRLCALPLAGSGESPGAAALRTLRRSFLVSADMAHSVHPSYAAKYEACHQPELNRGPVIKINANARYATSSPGIVLMREVARRAACPLQLFVVRNDSACGSTIGPMLSAKTGMRTLDLGNACLAMHSIREVAGTQDIDLAIRLFEGFYASYGELEEKILVD